MASIKKIIKKRWIGRYLISELHCIESKILPRIISDETAVRRFYKKHAGKELDLQNPQTFEAKMNWYKLYVHDPLMTKCADKVSVRDYVREKGYAETLNQLLGVYSKVSEIDLGRLPDRFVLKAAHGSHMNLIVTDKNAVNWKREKHLLSSWLHQDIYWSGREWSYKDVPKRLIAEAYLEDETGELKDYKFYCFNGKPYFLEFIGNRQTTEQYRNFYDMEMNLLEITDTFPNCPGIVMPITRSFFEKMKEMAEILAEPFQFVRVDLYAVQSKIYFGELTFYDSGGVYTFQPKEWNDIFGSHWKLVCHFEDGTR